MSKMEREHPAYDYGTDKEFLAWVSHQPSVIDGNFNQYNPNRNIACHVREISIGSGMGIKPPFSAVPMTNEQHRMQTLYGYNYFHPMSWWKKKRDWMVAQWIESVRARQEEA